jgi:multidrug efflux pump subunit AcrB
MQRISLMTLIVALGLLVDNAIVMAEEIGNRLAQGESRNDAATQAGGTLAVPLLTSSITTVLMFVPLALAPHASGEYLRSMAQVILIALATSWVLAMTVTPILCARFLQPAAPEGAPGMAVPSGEGGAVAPISLDGRRVCTRAPSGCCCAIAPSS